jgi:polyisoprenyl-phosphate glycosyltransferase
MKVPVSIVIPVYNEEKNIPLLFKRLDRLKNKLPKGSEVILVDDGSTDRTFYVASKTPLSFGTHILSFSRNFGHQSALLAGMEKAKGEIIITMDGDLQHPPELIPRMLELHKKNVDIVLTQRMDSEDTTTFKKTTAFLFYRLANLISDTTFSANSSDFRSLNRKALSAIFSLPEKRKFLRGVVQWIGFSSIVISYQAESRKHGKSKYSLMKMLRLGIYGVTSFSTLPLYLAVICSLFLFSTAFFYALYVLYVRFIVGSAVSGWASVTFVTLVVGGSTSLFLGLIGMYLAAIYDEVKQRPNYIIRRDISK